MYICVGWTNNYIFTKLQGPTISTIIISFFRNYKRPDFYALWISTAEAKIEINCWKKNIACFTQNHYFNATNHYICCFSIISDQCYFIVQFKVMELKHLIVGVGGLFTLLIIGIIATTALFVFIRRKKEEQIHLLKVETDRIEKRKQKFANVANSISSSKWKLIERCCYPKWILKRWIYMYTYMMNYMNVEGYLTRQWKCNRHLPNIHKKSKLVYS